MGLGLGSEAAEHARRPADQSKAQAQQLCSLSSAGASLWVLENRPRKYRQKGDSRALSLKHMSCHTTLTWLRAC